MQMTNLQRYCLCLTVFLVAAFAQTANAAHASNTDTAYNLFHACQDAIRVTDSPGPTPLGRADYCFGYFEGYTNVISFSNSKICLGKATIGTLIRVYLAYIEKNPKDLDYPNVIGVTSALAESYSCVASDKKP
jgi:hypothetical protein